MEPELKFVENEANTKELYAEFYIDKKSNKNIIATILIDNTTHENKKVNILEEFFNELGEYIDSTDITNSYRGKLNTPKLIEMLIKSEKGEDLSRNYYHY